MRLMTPMARAAPAKLAPTAVKMSRVVSALGDENDMDEEDIMIGSIKESVQGFGFCSESSLLRASKSGVAEDLRLFDVVVVGLFFL